MSKKKTKIIYVFVPAKIRIIFFVKIIEIREIKNITNYKYKLLTS